MGKSLRLARKNRTKYFWPTTKPGVIRVSFIQEDVEIWGQPGWQVPAMTGKGTSSRSLSRLSLKVEKVPRHFALAGAGRGPVDGNNIKVFCPSNRIHEGEDGDQCFRENESEKACNDPNATYN